MALLRYSNRLRHVEEAEAGEGEAIVDFAVQEGFFEAGELIGAHFAAVGAELRVEFAAHGEEGFVVEAGAGEGRHFVFEGGEALFELFEVAEVGGEAVLERVEGGGDIGVGAGGAAEGGGGSGEVGADGFGGKWRGFFVFESGAGGDIFGPWLLPLLRRPGHNRRGN